MTRDTIDRAIDRGAGTGDSENLDEITYEGYAPGGVAVLVETMTDNHKRTVAEVRHAFSKAGGNLGTDGSVAYLFSKKGQISLPPGCDEDQILEIVLDAGADDVISNDDGSIDVETEAEDFGPVREALANAGIEPTHSEVAMVASTSVELDETSSEKIMRLIDALEDLDDTQNVYSNAEFAPEFLEQLQ